MLGFLDDLARRARAFAEKDVGELRDFAKAELGIAELQAWDIAYASEKLRLKRYSFSDQEVKQYFPEEVAIRGLFRVAETLYGVKFVPAQAPTWHPDVRFFEVRDASGKAIGQFYMDLYARERSVAAPGWTTRSRAGRSATMSRTRSRTQLQFFAARRRWPALFTHDEVLTLFHEFGHGLHHLLTRVDDLGVSGINGVEWDAVELPSQFMENFCWEWDVLREMTRHVDTGQPLPKVLYDRMLAAKNFQSGLAMLRQIEFAVFDMRLHTTSIRRAAAARSICSTRSASRSRCSFRRIQPLREQLRPHLRRWLRRRLLQCAEVLSADAYSLLRKRVYSARTPARASATRSWPAAAARQPNRSARSAAGSRADALLRHNGMTTETAAT